MAEKGGHWVKSAGGGMSFVAASGASASTGLAGDDPFVADAQAKLDKLDKQLDAAYAKMERYTNPTMHAARGGYQMDVGRGTSAAKEYYDLKQKRDMAANVLAARQKKAAIASRLAATQANKPKPQMSARSIKEGTVLTIGGKPWTVRRKVEGSVFFTNGTYLTLSELRKAGITG
jgi:hypothetical protein